MSEDTQPEPCKPDAEPGVRSCNLPRDHEGPHLCSRCHTGWVFAAACPPGSAGPLVLPRDEYEAVRKVAGMLGMDQPAPALGERPAATTEPLEAFQADLAAIREQVEAALDRSIDRCARCKVCDTQINAVMAAVGVEFDRMHAALEHAQSAATGSHEGIRLWMLDCGELMREHHARAVAAEAKLEAAEARLAAIAEHCRLRMSRPGRSGMTMAAAGLILGLAEGIGEEEGGGDDWSFTEPVL